MTLTTTTTTTTPARGASRRCPIINKQTHRYAIVRPRDVAWDLRRVGGGGEGGFSPLIRLLSPIRNASARASAATFDRRLVHEVAFYFLPPSGASGSYSAGLKRFRAPGEVWGRGETKRNETPCFAVKVSLHRAKTRVSYERRVRRTRRRPMSVPRSLRSGAG